LQDVKNPFLNNGSLYKPGDEELILATL